jgi:hypothetical protein
VNIANSSPNLGNVLLGIHRTRSTTHKIPNTTPTPAQHAANPHASPSVHLLNSQLVPGNNFSPSNRRGSASLIATSSRSRSAVPATGVRSLLKNRCSRNPSPSPFLPNGNRLNPITSTNGNTESTYHRPAITPAGPNPSNGTPHFHNT